MSILSVSNLSKNFDDINLFNNINFFLEKDDKLALIGKNGAGKTTLIKILQGLEDYNEGSINFIQNINISYMSQEIDEKEGKTIFEYCRYIFNDLIKKEEELRKLEKEIANFNDFEDDFNNFLKKYEDKRKKFEDLNGYIYKSKIKGTLIGLGFSEDEFDKDINTLSGGEANRLNLARLLLKEPDLLLLDEPTNHLDFNSSLWLENYLKNYKKAVILISHDRYFIDSVANKILEIENKTCMLFNGNYTKFKKKKAEFISSNNKVYEKQQKEIKKQQDLIELYKARGTEKLAKRAKSREKMLEKIEVIEEIKSEKKDISLDFKIRVESGRDVFFTKNLSKNYNDKNILNNIDLDIKKGSKIGIVGVNGAGKSTLLKILSGEIKDYNGELKYGTNVEIAYYSQNLDEFNEENNILEEISDLKPNMNNEDIRTFLGNFLFRKEDVFKKIKFLSGGEKARVSLAKILLKKANVLLLDEPTNHLDIYTREILENAINNFNYTVISVSHDRYFLNSICSEIYEIENGKINHFIGNYDNYLEKKNINLNITKSLNDALKIGKNKQNEIEKIKRIQNREDFREKNKRITKFEREITKIENEIEKYEQNIKKIDELMCQEEYFSDYNKLNELNKEKQNFIKKIDNYYQKFYEYEEKISSLKKELDLN